MIKIEISIVENEKNKLLLSVVALDSINDKKKSILESTFARIAMEKVPQMLKDTEMNMSIMRGTKNAKIGRG